MLRVAPVADPPGSLPPSIAGSAAPDRPSRQDYSAREGIALGDVGRLLKRRWLAVTVPTLAALVLSVAFVQLVPPRYTAESKLLLESRDSALTRPQQERGDVVLPIDEQAVASQVQVVMSRDLAREAIKRLGLLGNREFNPLIDGPNPVEQVLALLGLVRNPLEREAEDRVLDTYFKNLLVYPAGKSRILTIEFRARDPELAARAANTIADLYLSSLAAAKVDTARFASTWLGTNIEALRSRVAEAEAKVETFRSKNGLIGGVSGTGTSQPIGTQQLTELSTQLTQARAAQADAAAKAKLIRDLIKDGRAFEIPDVANNELIRRLVEQRITLRAQLALESRTLLLQHPRIKELNAQLGDLEGQIRSAADRTVRTLENDARIAGSRVESLQAAVDGQREVVAKGNTSEVQLRALEREAKVQREQLESYLARYREAAARDAESAAPADARVVSRAVVPDLPSFPKKLPIVACATVLVFLLAAGLVLARSLIAGGPDDREGRRRPARPQDLDDAQPFERGFSPSPAGLRPVAEQAEPAGDIPANDPVARAAEQEPAGPASAPVEEPAAARPAIGPDGLTGVAERYAFDALITRISAIETAGGGRRILLVGTGTDEDLDTLSAALGRRLARDSRAVILRLDRGGDHPGLTDIVAGEAAFGEALRRDAGSRLHLIGRGFGEPALLLEERQGLGIALDALGQAYDWILCCLNDGPHPEARALIGLAAAWMDAVVIASNAAPDDAGLVALFEIAEAAGAPDVIVAREEGPPPVAMPAYPLRRSA